MGLIFTSEIFKGGEHRVGGCLAQAAHGRLLDGFCQFLQKLQVSRFSLALCNALQDLQHPPGAITAGEAFSAGLVTDKVHEIPGRIHHAGVLVHDNQAAGPHDGPKL